METVLLPANRDEIIVECTREFLVDLPAAGQQQGDESVLQQPSIRPLRTLPPIPVALAAATEEDE